MRRGKMSARHADGFVFLIGLVALFVGAAGLTAGLLSSSIAVVPLFTAILGAALTIASLLKSNAGKRA